MNENIKISDLIPDKNNANRGTERGRGMLEKSLSKYGAGRSILIDKNNQIIAGNKTAQVAGENGFENVRIIESDGSEIIAVKRTDLDLDKDKAARELAIADNRVGEIDLDWNLNIKTDDLNLDDFFSEEELTELQGSDQEKLREQENELEPYKKMHVLISIDVDKIDNIGDILTQLKKIDGVEIETKAN
jgi:hypothetical protein